MYKSTHRALARAVRDTGLQSGMNEDQVLAIANAMADVCEEHTPKSATFDREVFLAIATSSPQLAMGE
jgi:hypothetical protein